MAERVEEPEAEVEASRDQAGPAAVALALGRASRGAGGKAFDADAMAFLRDQRRLINLQTEHLHEQRDLTLAHLRVRRWKDRMSLALQALGVLVGTAFVIGLCVMALRAYGDHAVVIEAFAAPPAFAQRGVSGQAVAADVMDKLAAVRAVARAHSFSSTDRVESRGADEVKIEIPETGISLSEAWRLMRDWLGSERKVTGDLRDLGDGRIALSARIEGGEGGEAFSLAGAPAELDRLEQQAAERLYAATDPVNYVIYLGAMGRKTEALAAAARFAGVARNPVDRADAFSIWGTTSEDPVLHVRLSAIALRIDPKAMAAHFEMAAAQRELGHPEAVLVQARAILALQDADQPRQHRGAGVQEMRAFGRRMVDLMAGDFADAARQEAAYSAGQDTVGQLTTTAGDVGRRHDPHEAAAMISEAQSSGTPSPYVLLKASYDTDAAREAWSAALMDARALDASAKAAYAASHDPDEQAGLLVARQRQYAWRLAEAEAHAGDVADAVALVGSTPADCYDCLRARGEVAALAGDTAGAGRWFAEAVRQAPSLPFAHVDWGRMLLARGDVAAAIRQLQLAHAKGPRFADPLEIWGEALMRGRDYAGAAGKFAEAATDAPAWGKARLMQGEALLLAGRHAEARAQFEAADGLDLSAPDRAALKVFLARTASGPLHG